MKIKIFTVTFLLFFAATAFAQTFELPRKSDRIIKPRVRDRITKPRVIAPRVRETIKIIKPRIPRIRVSTTQGGPVVRKQIKALETAVQELEALITGLQNQIDALDINAVVTPQIKQLLGQILALQREIGTIKAQIPPIIQSTSFLQAMF